MTETQQTLLEKARRELEAAEANVARDDAETAINTAPIMRPSMPPRRAFSLCRKRFKLMPGRTSGFTCISWLPAA